MKKALLLAVLLCVSVYGFSQGTKYGVRAGYNISNLDFDGTPILDNEHRNGFAIGFFGEYGFTKTFALMPEIQFSSEGGKTKALRLDYIQVPVLFKFRLSERIHIGAGPQVGVKVYEHEDGIRNFAYSGVGGLEIKLSHEFFFDARYTYGFSNIFDDNQNVEAINTNIQLGIGYKF
ncbi:porin family protein [Snuella lapsa]